LWGLKMLLGILKMLICLITVPIRFMGTLIRFAAFLALPILAVKAVKMMVHHHHHHHE
jgi:hypothetical protein